MSDYIQFFVVNKNNYMELQSFSRSNPIFKAFDIDYGKVIELTDELYNKAINRLKNEENTYKNSIDKYEALKKDILSSNNPLEEKLDFISDLDNDIDEIKEDLISVQIQIAFLAMTKDIIVYEDYNYDKQSKAKIYVGKEIDLNSIKEIIER